ncbi:MAG: hypothetical protein WBA41_05700 [Rivularia sp. (in: cyanobacteria)]
MSIKSDRIFYYCDGSYYQLRENNSSVSRIGGKTNKIRLVNSGKNIGNEIFICVAILAILGINIGGSNLIQNRTKQKLIYNSVPIPITSPK